MHTEKSFRSLIKSKWNPFVFTIFPLIWHRKYVRLLPYQLYLPFFTRCMVNKIWFWFHLIRFRKYFSVWSQSPLLVILVICVILVTSLDWALKSIPNFGRTDIQLEFRRRIFAGVHADLSTNCWGPARSMKPLRHYGTMAPSGLRGTFLFVHLTWNATLVRVMERQFRPTIKNILYLYIFFPSI